MLLIDKYIHGELRIEYNIVDHMVKYRNIRINILDRNVDH